MPVSAEVDDDLPILDELAIQARGIAIDEDRDQQVQRGRARVGRSGRLVGVLKQRSLRIAPDEDAPLSGLLRLARTHGFGRSLARNGLEILASEREHFLGRHIACEHERLVVRRVVGAEEFLQIGERPGLDVRRPADRRELIGMRDERRGLHLFGEMAVVVVIDTELALGGDDTPLALDDFGIEREMRDAIGFEIEDQLQRVAGNQS